MMSRIQGFGQPLRVEGTHRLQYIVGTVGRMEEDAEAAEKRVFPPMVALEPFAKPLLFLHLIAAACALGSAIHLAIRLWGYFRGRVIKVPHEKLYARLLLISYAVCYGLGALIYPTFRIRVREEYFDDKLPSATALFELKEHFATIGLVIVAGTWLLSRNLPSPAGWSGRRLLPLYCGLVAVLLSLLVYNVWSGWYLTTLRSV